MSKPIYNKHLYGFLARTAMGDKPTRAKRIKALLIDIDGTLYFKGAPIPGADTALARLRQMGFALRFLTNIDSKSTASIQRQLAAMGLAVELAEVFSPAGALLQFLRQNPGKRCYLLVCAELAAEFADYAAPEGRVDYVVVGDLREGVSYAALNTAFRHLMNGAELIALQNGRYYIRADGYYLDTGAFVQLLEYGSGGRAQVLGKPSEAFFQLALDQLGCRADETAVVGDDITTDIAGARRIGALAVLVQTGKYSAESLADSAAQPDVIIGSIAALPALLEEQGP